MSPLAPHATSPGVADAPDYPRDPLWDALRQVEDPEMGISIVDMGMIVAAERVGGTGDGGALARVQITYTAMGCPAVEMIEDDIRARLASVPGVERVEIETVWEPVWTKARLTAEGRDALLFSGVAL